MGAFMERLQSGDVMVADGATGTNLQDMGLPAGVHTEDWVMENPQKILELETAFVDAGADIVLTCTFGATRPRLKGSPYADKVEDINRRAVDLALKAASRRSGVFVAGSMGPLGLLLKPYGPLEAPQAAEAYAEQALALADAGADVLVIETQFSLEEAGAALDGLRSATDLPLVVSFSYDRGTRTMMGVRPDQAARKFSALGAVLVGANCGTTLENMETVLQEYSSAVPGYPLWAKPNAGMPRIEGTKTVYDVTPMQMAEFAQRAVQHGARVVGGCCGSTPEHVRAMADRLREGGILRSAQA